MANSNMAQYLGKMKSKGKLKGTGKHSQAVAASKKGRKAADC